MRETAKTIDREYIRDVDAQPHAKKKMTTRRSELRTARVP